MRYISGTKLDERVIRCDLDPGYREGRQFGRGKNGGQVRCSLLSRCRPSLLTRPVALRSHPPQVRDEFRQEYDAGRGQTSVSLTLAQVTDSRARRLQAAGDISGLSRRSKLKTERERPRSTRSTRPRKAASGSTGALCLTVPRATGTRSSTPPLTINDSGARILTRKMHPGIARSASSSSRGCPVFTSVSLTTRLACAEA